MNWSRCQIGHVMKKRWLILEPDMAWEDGQIIWVGKKECVKSQKEEEEVAARGVADPSWLGWVLGEGNWSRRQSVLGMLAIARPSVRRHHTRAHYTMLQAFLVNSHSSVFNTFQPISELSEADSTADDFASFSPEPHLLGWGSLCIYELMEE